MGFNRRKMEDERRRIAEKEAASRRATDAQVLEDAERLIAVDPWLTLTRGRNEAGPFDSPQAIRFTSRWRGRGLIGKARNIATISKQFSGPWLHHLIQSNHCK
jgi:hypothetical protein